MGVKLELNYSGERPAIAKCDEKNGSEKSESKRRKTEWMTNDEIDAHIVKPSQHLGLMLDLEM
jgi:hypothetical protein